MKKFTMILAVLAVAVLATGAQAASITWSAQGDLPDAAAADQKIQNTNIVFASTLIDTSSTGSVTVNGVAFYEDYDTTNNGGSVYVSSVITEVSNTLSANGGLPLPNWSTAMGTLMDAFRATADSGTGTVTLSGLTVGQEYKVQILGYVDIWTIGESMEITDGEATPNSTGPFNGFNNAWYYIASFTADATTQNFVFIGHGSERAYLSAINVAIPEPATMGLLGIGGLLALIRKNR